MSYNYISSPVPSLEPVPCVLKKLVNPKPTQHNQSVIRANSLDQDEMLSNSAFQAVWHSFSHTVSDIETLWKLKQTRNLVDDNWRSKSWSIDILQFLLRVAPDLFANRTDISQMAFINQSIGLSGIVEYGRTSLNWTGNKH